MNNYWIYQKVNQLIKQYDTRDPEKLIKALHIRLQYMNPTQSLLGVYKIILKNRYIFIPNNVGSLKKTVLAHELGHDQLHRKECIDGATFHESRVFHSTSKFELEANIFAAHLLIPNEEVIDMIRYASSDRALAGDLGVDINLLNLKISEMAKMGLLDLDRTDLNIPNSSFLKTYRPLDDDWDIC